MNFNRFSLIYPSRKPLFRLLPLLLIVLAIVGTGTTSTINRSTSSQGSGMRQIKIERKNNHPVAIKQIRNAQSDRFLHDVEIEIENLTNKPIYYVCLNMRFPDIEIEPKRYYGFSLIYGDVRFDRIAELASPQDQPILPGGTVTLTVPSSIWEGFEWYKNEKNLPPAATNKVEIQLEEVSFGDGTGYEDGKPYPRIPSSGKNLSSKSKGEIAIKQLTTSPDDLYRVFFIPSTASSFSDLKKTL
jgi:hypothetical protein